MALFKRSKQAFESFKAHADGTRHYGRGQRLADAAIGEGMVYEVNPVYLEIGQGGNSPMRGTGALIFLGMFIFGNMMAFESIFALPTLVAQDEIGWLGVVFDLLLSGLVLLLAYLVAGYWLVTSFLNVTDVTVRFDRKRQTVWMWTGRGPIQMRWADLTPAVRGTAASPYMLNRLYRGLFVELDAEGEARRTPLKMAWKYIDVPHAVQCGQVSSDASGVLPAMEYVRRYMEHGPEALPPIIKPLQHRPRWWAMINLFGMIDDWIDYRAGRLPPGIGAPWGTTLTFILMFPLLFPLQFTNWLALRFAPLPTWPAELEALHRADLAALNTATSASPRKPVVRVNGVVIDSE